MATIHDKFEALARSEALALLQTTLIGRIGFVVDGQPYVLPVNYAADDRGNVVFRTGETGLLAGLAGRVAFEADGYELKRRSGWSVHVTGCASEITDDEDAAAVHLRQLGVSPWAAGPRGRWFRIAADQVSGRRVVGRVVDEWFAGVPVS